MEDVCAQNECKTKPGSAVLLSNLLESVYPNAALQMAQPSPKKHTHTHTVKMDGKGEKRKGGREACSANAESDLTPSLPDEKAP